MNYTYTTQAQLRQAFWAEHPRLARRWINGPDRPIRPQNWQPVDTRCAFVDWIDHLARDGQISEALAQRVTL